MFRSEFQRFGVSALLVAGALLPSSLRAQSCAMPVANDFKIDTLANNATGDLYENSSSNGGESGSYGVVQIAVAPNGKVFIGKMCSGQIRVYRPGTTAATATVRAGTVPTRCDNEDGLLGLVLDRNFMTNRWIYVFHTDINSATSPLNSATGKAHLLTRYTYDSTAAAGSQLTNSKLILKVDRMIDTRAYHAGGGIDMGSDGVLVIGTGDDTSPHSGECNSNNAAPILWNSIKCDAQKSSGNTAALTGKMLRIVPIAFADNTSPVAGIGTTYNIPPGNLWEMIDNPSFNPNWNPAEDTLAKVRKEIYTMGHRNPYHPRIDTKSGWIFTGEVGLDMANTTAYTPSRGPEGREEWNLATRPGFYGHPYCVGNNKPWRRFTWPATTWTTTGVDTFYNCAAVQNVSPNNKGIRNLPPAREATLFYSNQSGNGDDSYRLGFTSGETALGGPMYRYDSNLVSSVKFPPQYEGKIFFFDWAVTNKSSFRIVNIKADGTLDSGTAATPAFPAATLAALPNGGYIDMRFGPHDGAMYLLRNNTGGSGYTGFNNASLYRISYKGTINNACYTPFNTTVGPGPVSVKAKVFRTASATLMANGFVTLPSGYRTVTLYNLSGRKIWSHTRSTAEGMTSVKIPSDLSAGMLQARLTP
jgi:cytochrome c